MDHTRCNRAVQPFGVSGPHWKKKSCLGSHIKYTNTNENWWEKIKDFRQIYDFVLGCIHSLLGHLCQWARGWTPLEAHVLYSGTSFLSPASLWALDLPTLFRRLMTNFPVYRNHRFWGWVGDRESRYREPHWEQQEVIASIEEDTIKHIQILKITAILNHNLESLSIGAAFCLSAACESGF